MAQCKRIVWTQTLNVMHLEACTLHAKHDVADAIKLAIWEHVTIDKLAGLRFVPALAAYA